MKTKKALDIARFYCISPEIAVVAGVGGLYFVYPQLLLAIGQEVARQDSVVQYLAWLPLGLLAVTFRLANEVLRPSDAANSRILYEWPDYWRVKYRSLGAVFFCVVASIISLGTWIFKAHLGMELLGGGLLGAIFMALFATWTQFLARLKIREILEGRQ
jgi:hypothetical protein